jgi:hypothetical protein
MNHKRTLVYINGILLVLLLSAACGTPQPTSTTLLSTTTPTSFPAEEEIEWDYITLGDSMMGGVGELYSGYLEEDLDIEVNFLDMWRSNLYADALLKRLRNNDREREYIHEAEVITFDMSPGFIPGALSCIFGTGISPVVQEDEIEEYKAVLRAIIEEIFSLRSGSPTIIRTMTYFNPKINDQKEQGIYEECQNITEMINDAIHEVSAEYGIPVAEVYDAFHGPNHDQDPKTKGYISPDGLHPSELGRRIIADAYRELGYEIIQP